LSLLNTAAQSLVFVRQEALEQIVIDISY